MRYHPVLKERVVHNMDEHDAARAEGFVESPAELPQPDPADPTRCPTCGQKLPIAPAGPAPPANQRTR